MVIFVLNIIFCLFKYKFIQISRDNLKASENFQKILYACTLSGSYKDKCSALIETIEIFEKISIKIPNLVLGVNTFIQKKKGI